MRNVLASLLLATAVGLGGAANAADPPKTANPPAQAGGLAGHAGMESGMMRHGRTGHGMMKHGAMEMAAMHCMGLSETRLAAAKAELKITEAQTPQWNAFAAAEASSAAAMGRGMMQGVGHDHAAHSGSEMTMMSGPLPERLERQEAMMNAHLEGLKKVRAAVSPLYEALTPEQRAKADQVLCGGMNRHGAGSAAHHAHAHSQ